MEYVAPYGVADPNAPYINGDPTLGRQGSIPPAAAFEHPMRELVNIINKSQIVPDDTDLMQVAKGIRSQRMNFVTDTGSTNTLSVALDPVVTAYTAGLVLRIRVAVTNTGAVTLNAGGGVHSVRRINGSEMVAGDLPAGGIIEVVWTGTFWQMTNFFGQPGAGGGGGDTNNYYVKIPFAVDSGAVNATVANFVPAITALNDGDVFLVRIAYVPTGPTTLKVNALPAYPIKTRDGANISANLIINGEDLLLVWDSPSSWFRLIGVQSPSAVTGRFTSCVSWSVTGTYGWTVPANVFTVFYEVWGAGGGGGGAVTPSGAAPGGGGGYAAGYMAVTPGQLLIATVGVGGGAPIANAYVSGYTGNSSTWAGVATAFGGGGGEGGNGYNAASGGLGGGAVGGMICIPGQAGQCSNTPSMNSNYPMAGGGARLGGATGQNLGGYPRGNAAGGAGGNNTYAGQQGGDGLIIVHY